MNFRDTQLAPLRLFLIRHGLTDWTVTGQHTGLSDVRLNATGVDEARQLGPLLKDIQFSHVLTSPLSRATETCRLAGLSAVSETDRRLVEWNYGDYDGKTTAEIHQQRPGWTVFRDGCPNGESPADVTSRADRLIERLRTLHGNVALFTHAQFGGVIAARWIRWPTDCAQHFPLHTASVSILSSDLAHPDTPTVALWNCTSHIGSTLEHPPLSSLSVTQRQRALQRWDNEGGEIPPSERNAS
jgi:broad specificity phosphatase PhoE